MPNRVDLVDALDALGRDADSYPLRLDLAARTSSSARRPRRSRVPAMLIAACAVTALGLGAAHWATRQNDSQVPAGGGGSLPVRALDFSLEPGSGWTPQEWHAALDLEQVTLTSSDGTAVVELTSPGAFDLEPQAGVDEVDVNGRPGWYVAGDGPGIIENWDRNDPASPGPGQNVDSAQQLVFQYESGAWAFVHPSRGGLDRAGVISAARALDFDRQQTLSAPFKLVDAPLGEQLRAFAVDKGSDWQARADWGTSDWTDLEITLYKIDPLKAGLSNRGPSHFTAAGHPAWWYGNALDIDLGDGLGLEIRNPTDEDHPANLTREQAAAIADSITIAPEPMNPDSWYPAATALP